MEKAETPLNVPISSFLRKLDLGDMGFGFADAEGGTAESRAKERGQLGQAACRLLSASSTTPVITEVPQGSERQPWKGQQPGCPQPEAEATLT